MSPPVVIGLLGKKRSGKDTLAGYLVDDHGFARYAFADPLRAVALDLDPLVPGALTSDPTCHFRLSAVVRAVGWEDAKELPEVRRTLQYLGVAMRDHVDRDVWLNTTLRQVMRERRPVVLTDVRFPNEADGIERALGGALVRVVRPGLESSDAHVSETALDGRRVEWLVRNEGTAADLRGVAATLAASVPPARPRSVMVW